MDIGPSDNHSDKKRKTGRRVKSETVTVKDDKEGLLADLTNQFSYESVSRRTRSRSNSSPLKSLAARTEGSLDTAERGERDVKTDIADH